MKRLWVKPWLCGASLVVVGLVILLAWSLWPRRAAKQGISVSRPIFASYTNVAEICETVSFTVSNGGLRSLQFYVGWLECRAGTNLTLSTATHSTPKLLHRWVPLASGATTVLTMNLPKGPSPPADRLFCCWLHWWENEPAWWRIARGFDPWLSETLGIFTSPQYVPPWASASDAPARGEVFTSNVEVAEYFRLMYGFTRSKWLEDIARKEQAATNAPARSRYGLMSETMPARTSTPQEIIESQARSAFDTFCRITSDVSQDAEPGAPPNLGPATPPGSSNGFGEGRHR